MLLGAGGLEVLSSALLEHHCHFLDLLDPFVGLDIDGLLIGLGDEIGQGIALEFGADDRRIWDQLCLYMRT